MDYRQACEDESKGKINQEFPVYSVHFVWVRKRVRCNRQTKNRIFVLFIRENLRHLPNKTMHSLANRLGLIHQVTQ